MDEKIENLSQVIGDAVLEAAGIATIRREPFAVLPLSPLAVVHGRIVLRARTWNDVVAIVDALRGAEDDAERISLAREATLDMVVYPPRDEAAAYLAARPLLWTAMYEARDELDRIAGLPVKKAA